MAKAWRNKSGTLMLTGFDDLIEKLQAAGKTIDVEGRKCFEQAAENLYDSLYEQSTKAGLSTRLVEQIDERFAERGNVAYWFYEVGWKKTKPSVGNPLPDFYKVMFYNYGTPNERKTEKSGIRTQIDGKWVTLDRSRGKETAHPVGSHGFIKKAKLSASNKNKKLFKTFLDDVLGDL